MRFKAVLALFFLASACQTVPKEPIVQRVYCLTPDQYAALVKAEPAKVGGTLTGDSQQDFKIAAGQNVLMRQYADGLLQVLGGCVK